MAERIIINARGETKVVRPKERVVFSDKKENIVDQASVLAHLAESRRIYREMEVGQKEATIELNPKYPELPAFVWLNCDDHLGSKLVDYKAFLRDYKIVKETPNFFVLNNGDEVDHFMITLGSAATGVYETPITPEQQSRLVRELFKDLDDQDKILAFSFGNHNQWLRGAGYKFENTWLADFKCPVLNCGGMLKVKYGNQEYKIAMTHHFWGHSKLNPTNMAKRFMEHAYPSADILFLGHYHQSEYLFFKRDAETEYKWAIVGGTYKIDDEYAPEHGISHAFGHLGGFVLELSPHKRDISILKSVEEAREYFETLRELASLS